MLTDTDLSSEMIHNRSECISEKKRDPYGHYFYP